VNSCCAPTPFLMPSPFPTPRPGTVSLLPAAEMGTVSFLFFSSCSFYRLAISSLLFSYSDGNGQVLCFFFPEIGEMAILRPGSFFRSFFFWGPPFPMAWVWRQENPRFLTPKAHLSVVLGVFPPVAGWTHLFSTPPFFFGRREIVFFFFGQEIGPLFSFFASPFLPCGGRGTAFFFGRAFPPRVVLLA